MAYPADARQRAILRALLNELLARKPRGWSAVMSTGELVLRPPDRARGRFSIQFSRDELRIAFFDRALNHWAASRYVQRGPDAAEEPISWAHALCPHPEVSEAEA